MSHILQVLGTSTPVSETVARKLGLVRASLVCRVFFYQQLRDGVCKASNQAFQDSLGLSAGAVSSNLKWLLENGWIVNTEPLVKGNRPNHYIVTQKFLDLLDPPSDKNQHSRDERDTPPPSRGESPRSRGECDLHEVKVHVHEVNGKEESKESFKKKQQQPRKVLTGKKPSKPIQEKQKPLDPNDCRDYGQVAWLYEDSIGLLNLVTGQTLGAMVDEHGPKLVGQAIVVAVKRNKRNLAYVEGILKRAKAQGGQVKLQKRGKNDRNERNGRATNSRGNSGPATTGAIPATRDVAAAFANVARTGRR